MPPSGGIVEDPCWRAGDRSSVGAMASSKRLSSVAGGYQLPRESHCETGSQCSAVRRRSPRGFHHDRHSTSNVSRIASETDGYSLRRRRAILSIEGGDGVGVYCQPRALTGRFSSLLSRSADNSNPHVCHSGTSNRSFQTSSPSRYTGQRYKRRNSRSSDSASRNVV